MRLHPHLHAAVHGYVHVRIAKGETGVQEREREREGRREVGEGEGEIGRKGRDGRV